MLRHRFRNPALAAIALLADKLGATMTDYPQQPWVESPNTVLAGPPAGTDKMPAGFRTLVAADIAAAVGADFLVAGLAAGYKVARGQSTLTSALTTVVTGLNTVVAAVACMESAPILTCDRCNAQVGDQAGAPAAGSIILDAWMPTDATHTTPIAATGYAGIKVNWIAIGT
jgi:hypothetical protein